MNEKFYLVVMSSDPLSPDMVYSGDSGLKLCVYHLDKVAFTPNENEIQLYGYWTCNLLAFETVDISADNALEVLSAIKWYTRYIGCPEMEILPDDPRMGHEIAV